MLRPRVAQPPPGICQICTSTIYRNSRSAKRPPSAPLTAAQPGTGSKGDSAVRPARTPRERCPPPSACSSASSPLPRPHFFAAPFGWTSRTRAGALPLATAPHSRAFFASSTTGLKLGKGSQSQSQNGSVPRRNAAASCPPLSPLEKVVAPVLHVKQAFLGQHGIPTEDSTLSALRACEVAAGQLRNSVVPPQLGALEPQSSSSTSALLSLDASRGEPSAGTSTASAGDDAGTGAAKGHAPSSRAPQPALGSCSPPRQAQASLADQQAAAAQPSPSRQLKSAIDTVSETAYALVALPTVFITPKILELYVSVQSRLGRPEFLPQILAMYASKPVPQAQGTSIRYLEQNPNKATNAVDPAVAETALDAAIEARNMDAAVAVIENAYTTRAFVRSKLLRKALLPASCFAALPVCLYALAAGLSRFQHTMDDSTATAVAFAGIATYVGFTAAIGLVASATGNDHMKRVTWAPGTPLTQRWIREEERAALDRVACSFGFSEPHRYGEEEGAEFEALREYILRKGMILDRVELMEGMGQ